MLGSLAAASQLSSPLETRTFIASLDRSGLSFCLRELVIPLAVRLQSLHYPISLPDAGADNLWLHLPPLSSDSGKGLSSWSLLLAGSASDLPSPCTSQPFPLELGEGMMFPVACCSRAQGAVVLRRKSRCLVQGS